jgi:4-hydroxy-3-polyprenylbenzoate decarboxylase
MAITHNSLRDFIHDLDKAGELIRVNTPIDIYLELTELTDRISKSPDKNKALLINKPRGQDGRIYETPILINALGSHKRLEMAIGNCDEIAARIRSFIKPEVPEGLGAKIQKVLQLAEARNFLPKIVKNAPCQEVVVLASDSHLNGGGAELLDKLPIITCWPEDGGPYITLTSVFTRDPDALGSGRNVGMYRLQKFDDITTAMHWHKHHDGARNYVKTLKRGSRMEVAIAIGADPAVIYSGTAPLPPGIDEMILAGFIRNQPVELVQCKTIDLQVPAQAEIIIEGYIDLSEELVTEGPFGDHTGFYSLADKYPKLHVMALTHRRDPIYATTIVGIPPQEDCYLGKATERIFLPLLQLICPEIIDMDLPWDGVFHNCAIVSINKQYAGHAQKVMNSIWGTGQMAWTKTIIVLDSDVDVHDYHQVAMHAFGNVDPQRDMSFTKGPLDILDHAAPIMGYGSKVGIDATRKWADEGFTREWPGLITMSDEVKRKVDQRWGEYFN